MNRSGSVPLVKLLFLALSACKGDGEKTVVLGVILNKIVENLSH